MDTLSFSKYLPFGKLEIFSRKRDAPPKKP